MPDIVDRQLDLLQEEVEHLLRLLRARELGINQWWSALASRVVAIGEWCPKPEEADDATP